MPLIDTLKGPMDSADLDCTVEVRITPTGRAEQTIFYHQGEVVRQDVTFFANAEFAASSFTEAASLEV